MTAAHGALGLLFAAAPAKKSALPQIWIFAAIGAAFYFLIYRPQQKKQKAARSQVNAYEVGDEVVTAGGIVGRVIDITDDRVTLETSVGASFVVMKPYILRKLEPADAPLDVVGESEDLPYDNANGEPTGGDVPGSASNQSTGGATPPDSGLAKPGDSDAPEDPDAPGADRPPKA